MVAYADGELHKDELNTLIEAGRSLGMSDNHVRGVMMERMEKNKEN